MEVLNIFLTEVLDTVPSDNQKAELYDIDTGTLKLASLLQHPNVITHLIFRNTWKALVSVYPSRHLTAEYMAHSKIRGRLDMNEFIGFAKSHVPILNYISFSQDMLNQSIDTYISHLKDQANVKKELIAKFVHRYGLELDNVDPKQSLFAVFKACVLHTVGHERLRMISNSLAVLKQVDAYSFPDSIKSITQYYQISEQIIQHYDLVHFNPFNLSYNSSTPSDSTAQTVFDAINSTAAADSSFYRFVLGSHSIYWESGKMMDHERLENLMNAANMRSNKSNIILFVSPCSVPSFQPNYHYFTYFVLHPCLMKMVPAVATVYVMASENVFPNAPSIILSSKPEMSIYYCLNENGDAGAATPYVSQYNRYLGTMSNVKLLRSAVTGKQIYTIVDQQSERHVIYNNEFVEHQWSAHLTMACPYSASSQYHPTFNVLLFDQFLLKYYAENESKLRKLATINRTAKNTLLLVDNRQNIFSVIALWFTLANLQQGKWNVIIVCNHENYTFFHRFFGDKAEYIRDIHLPSKKFAIEMYNELLKSAPFWERFAGKYERVLFVQDDGMLVRPGMEKVFIKYDYVGAPWRREWAHENPNKHIVDEINPQLVGNGGVSLRNPARMLEFVKKYKDQTRQLHYDKVQQQPEDVFFACCGVKENALMPTYEIAQQFACEQVFHPQSFGFHKPWVYHDLTVAEKLFTSYLNSPLFG